MSIFAELRRRNVLRTAAAYIVSSWLLIQVAETIFPLFGFDETPARIVVIVLAIGFVPALILSWAFELTPDGWRKESDVDHNAAPMAASAKRIDRVIMVTLAIGLAYFAIDKFVFSESRQAVLIEQAREDAFAEAQRVFDSNKSIAVLPFEDLSAEQDQQFLADGISGEILNILAGLEGLNVTARTSSFQFRDPDRVPQEIGGRLGVRYILEGNIRKTGEQVRVMAQLVDAQSGFQIDSWPFEARLDEIFDIQVDVARAVAGALSIALDIEGRNELPGARTDNIDAYLAFLEGRESVSRSVEWDRAIALFDRALALDPNYVDAIVERGVMHAFMSFTMPSAEARASQERGLAMVQEAIRIDPGFARAYDVLARFIWTRGDWIGATQTYEKYAELAPADIPAQLGFTNVMARTGRLRDSARIGEMEARNDPVSILGAHVRAERLIQVGEYEEALETLALADRISPPPQQGTDFRRLFLAISIGEDDGIRIAMENYALADRRAKPVVEAILADFDADRLSRLKNMRETFETDTTLTGESRVIIASMAAHLGDPELALDVFEKEFEINVQRVNRLWYPYFSEMRSLPGFKALAEHLNYVEYWRTYGWADTCRPLGGDDFECE